MTMGAAIDWAIGKHKQEYPGSVVYHAEISQGDELLLVVELRATHFSVPLYYHVSWIPEDLCRHSCSCSE